MHQLSLFQSKISPAQILPEDHLIVNFSGGKDSLWTLIMMKKLFPTHQLTVIYNDTGFEHHGIWEYIQSVTAQLAVSVIKIDSPGLFNIIRQRGDLPSQLCRFCTSSLKRDLSAKFIRQQFPQGRVINIFGFRAEESPDRARKQIFSVDPRLTTKQRTVIQYAPIHTFTEGDVKEAIRAEGFSLFPSYDYLSRLSCRFCFLAGKRDQDAVKLNDPNGYAAVVELKDSLH